MKRFTAFILFLRLRIYSETAALELAYMSFKRQLVLEFLRCRGVEKHGFLQKSAEMVKITIDKY